MRRLGSIHKHLFCLFVLRQMDVKYFGLFGFYYYPWGVYHLGGLEKARAYLNQVPRDWWLNVPSKGHEGLPTSSSISLLGSGLSVTWRETSRSAVQHYFDHQVTLIFFYRCSFHEKQTCKYVTLYTLTLKIVCERFLSTLIVLSYLKRRARWICWKLSANLLKDVSGKASLKAKTTAIVTNSSSCLLAAIARI